MVWKSEVVWQADRLDTQAGGDAVTLRLVSMERATSPETDTGIDIAILENFFFFRKPCIFLRPSTD